jgi:MFS superfamily sulfate permease-like transporter
VVENLLSPQKLQILSWILLLVFTIGSWVVLSSSFALAVLVGGIISILSFLVLQKDVVRFIESYAPDQDEEIEKKKIKKITIGLVIKFWFRLLIIGVILFLLIRSHKVNVTGLILGLSTVMCTVTIALLNVAGHYIFSGRR